MSIQLNFWPTAAFVGVLLCWWVFAAVFLFRKKPPRVVERKRESASTWGIVLVGAAHAIAWSVRRPFFTPLLPLGKPLEIALALASVTLGAASVWLIAAAVRTLGQQWACTARVVVGHRLVTEGPYRVVRNPIYTGMLGMLLATSLAVSHWAALPPAIVLFAIGTAIRIRSEEKLLRETFGAAFEEYARRVPAVFPRLL